MKDKSIYNRRWNLNVAALFKRGLAMFVLASLLIGLHTPAALADGVPCRVRWSDTGECVYDPGALLEGIYDECKTDSMCDYESCIIGAASGSPSETCPIAGGGGLPFNAGANSDGTSGGTMYAECSILGSTCAAAAALAGDACITAHATFAVFPDSEIEACASFASAMGIASAVTIVDAAVGAAAQVESYQYIPGKEGYKECTSGVDPVGIGVEITPGKCTEYAAEEARLEKLGTDPQDCEDLQAVLDPFTRFVISCGVTANGISDATCWKANAEGASESGPFHSKAVAEADGCDEYAALEFMDMLLADGQEKAARLMAEAMQGGLLVPLSAPSPWASVGDLVRAVGGTPWQLAAALEKPYNQTFEAAFERPLGDNLTALASIRDFSAFVRAISALVDGRQLYIVETSLLSEATVERLSNMIRTTAERQFDQHFAEFRSRFHDDDAAEKFMLSLREPLLDGLTLPESVVLVP